MEKFNFKKKFGQNFLKDISIVKRIVSCSGVNSNDLVIEVGPGKGILTKVLADSSKNVISYEIDNDLVSTLQDIEKETFNVHFIFADFMKRNIVEDIKDYSYDNLYFVSNVPYYITTPILMKLIDSSLKFKKIVMMVQKEVGDRFSAKEGTKSYGSLTVFLNYFYNVKKEFDVNRNEFIPVPNVDSVIVSLASKNELLPLNDKEFFFKLVKDSFQFKRKNIKNNLSNYDLKIIEEVLLKNGYSLSSRAEELPVSIFVELSNELRK